jgi:hypothetical protein
MRSSGLLGILARVMLSIGCASSQISSIPISAKPTHKVQAIAMAPGGGLLADAVAVELANRGLTVIDPSSTSNLLVRLNLTEIEVARPEGLAKLRDHGIDAYLVVRSAAGADGRPESVSARMNSTYTGQVLAGVTWQNGWGGVAGSPADRTMRKNLVEAANEIANALAQRVSQGT